MQSTVQPPTQPAMPPPAQPPVVAPAPLSRTGLQSDLLAAYDELIARTSWDRAQLRAHQQQRLRLLLRHAVAHSPFHAERLRGLLIDDLSPEDLGVLPVMTKSDLMDHFDDAVTDRRMTRAAAEAAIAAARDEPAIVHGGALAFTTGGSSGPRGVFLQDQPTVVQLVGSLSRALVARLRALGAPPGGLRIAMVAAGSPVHATGAAAWLTAGGRLPFHFVSVPVTAPLAEIVASLNALAPGALFGYPTVLARLAEEQVAGRLRIAPAMVTCTSETLAPGLRAAMRAGFGVPIVDTYGSTEGLTGVSAPDDDVLVFAEDGCIVEPVDAENRPVPPGTPSDGVLITLLDNLVQPLIRYRMPDRFVVQPPAAEHGYLRVRVEGRSDEILRFGKVLVHPVIIRSVLVHRPEVIDYQVRQTPDGIALQVIPQGVFDPAGLRAELARALREAGLSAPTVTVEAVRELPRDERTGKLRRFCARS